MFSNLGGTLKAINGAWLFVVWSQGVNQSTGGTFDGTDGTILFGGRWSQLKGNAIGSSAKVGDTLRAGAATTEIGVTGLGLEWNSTSWKLIGSSTNTLENTGLLTLTGGGLREIDGTGSTFLNSGTFVHALAERIRLGSASNVTFANAGTFQYAIASSRVYGHTGARFDNLPGGVMEVSTAGSHNFEIAPGQTRQVFRNQGEVVMTNSGDMSLGSWSIDSNTLNGIGTLLEGTWDIGNGSVFNFNGGAATIVTINDGAEVVLRGSGSMNKLGSDLATVHGVLGIYDDAVFDAGASLEFNAGTLEFGLDHAASALEDTTRIDVGNFSIDSGAVLRIVDLVDDLQIGDSFTLVNYSGTLLGSGNFTVEVDSVTDMSADVTYGDGNDDAITITLVAAGVLAGDVNGDGNVDTQDISPFVAALLAEDEAAFLLLYEDGLYDAADVNEDGNVDTQDITPFVEAILGAGTEVPEPATMALLSIGAFGLVVRRRRKVLS